MARPITAKRIPSSASKDIRQFLLGYPDQGPGSNKNHANLLFYTNKGTARPSQLRIDDLHSHMHANYRELEGSHSFIQWFFPIQEMGVNWESQPLNKVELSTLRNDDDALSRLEASYTIMLDFYGMRLVSTSTGEVARSDTPAPASGSWRVRYANLKSNMHNYLRITRILKCLSEFGKEHLNAGWLLFFLVEQARGELNSAALTRSMDGYWRWCIRDDDEREWVVNKIDEVRRGAPWTEQDYRDALARREKYGSFEVSHVADAEGVEEVERE